MIQTHISTKLMLLLPGLAFCNSILAQVDIAPDKTEVYAPFCQKDVEQFKNPPKVYYPETWFHFIGSNISKEGISADLEAINAAGLSGIQWFHGDFGGKWPKVEKDIKALTPDWEEMVSFMGQKAKDLGLRFTIQTCPGWAMAGGPWIEPKDAMRNLAWSRTDIEGGQTVKQKLPVPQPSSEPWRDYKDICVLAFPTPTGDTGLPLIPTSVKSSDNMNWADCFQTKLKAPLQLKEGSEHTVSFTMPEGTVIRTLQMPNINSWNVRWVYQPDVHLKLTAFLADGTSKNILDMDVPMSNWQDSFDFEAACHEVENAQRYEFTVKCKHPITLPYVHFFSGARKNNWRAEAGWTLTAKEKYQQHTQQSKENFVQESSVIDLTSQTDAEGNLTWNAPAGKKWTILRIGHVNTGHQNAPAPKEATGWECNKLDPRGADIQFKNYVGHLFDGPLKGSLANGMLMDSWECFTQTWTDKMEQEFATRTGYKLRNWLPAILGYTVNNQETTSRFLLDWRRVLNDLYNENFFKRMTDLAHEKGLKVQYETAPADIVPTDALEYYKYADVPMCEFWQPFEDSYVGDNNFKPIRPTASAARLYGKLRVAAETFTSFSLTWDEHWEMLKDVANFNMVDGVTHNVFHTYTHNPQVGFLPPGSSFGSSIGTPFLRQQTWWKYMPEFTRYLARTSYLLERGRSVSDVLWYLGDEISHRPNQHDYFPAGFKHDYCNPDVLLNRLSIKDGKFVTPEGLEYSVMWIPENERMLPETLEKLYSLIRQGGRVIGNAPQSPATLKNLRQTTHRFKAAVKTIWGKDGKQGVRNVGKGKVAIGMNLEKGLEAFGLQPDVKTTDGSVQWLHRRIDNADWYYVTAPAQGEFHGDVLFHTQGTPEEWDAVNGKTYLANSKQEGEYQKLHLDLSHAENRFIVFRHDGTSQAEPKKLPNKGNTIQLESPWTVNFPNGWGAPEKISITELKPWKDLPLGKEGQSFSGTAKYSTTFKLDKVEPDMNFTLDLGQVDMIADVKINGKKAGVLWANPYTLYIGDLIKTGENTLEIDVTSTWYNRLVYDAGQPESVRKTWTISGPAANSPLHNSGLIGPVKICY